MYSWVHRGVYIGCIQRICRGYTGYIYRMHTGHIQGIYRVCMHIGCIQGIYRVYKNELGMFWGCVWDDLGMFLVCVGYVLGCFRNVLGMFFGYAKIF